MYIGIQFSGYKLFCEESTLEFDKITNINVIIGKNNSGKSSLLDVIEMAYDEASFKKQKTTNWFDKSEYTNNKRYGSKYLFRVQEYW